MSAGFIFSTRVHVASVLIACALRILPDCPARDLLVDVIKHYKRHVIVTVQERQP